MPNKIILITGGAGFIGSHVADELLREGYRVRVLDSLIEQVHGPARQRPAYLNKEVELIVGDVRNRTILRKALKGVSAVYHFAAMVGVGQSMYQIQEYTDVNNTGTAILLEELIKHPVERLVVASSMSIYGEGMYENRKGQKVEGTDRCLDQLKQTQWEVCDEKGQVLRPIPTPEGKTPSLASVYALSKYDQEKMCMLVGRAYNIPTVALRFFNVYGSRQTLSNPYTGVLAIFASRFLNNKSSLIFEDGYQKRDFVSVYDLANACHLALKVPQAAYESFNIGSGNSYTIRDIATQMGEVLGKPHLTPEITGKYRVGDIRHCFADISKAQRILGYQPKVSLKEGMEELAKWLEGQVAVDRVSEMQRELEARGLAV